MATDDWVPPVLDRSKPSWLSSSVRVFKIVESGLVPYPLTAERLNHLLFCSKLMSEVNNDPEIKAIRGRVAAAKAEEQQDNSAPSSSFGSSCDDADSSAAGSSADSTLPNSSCALLPPPSAIPDENVVAFLDSLTALLSLISRSLITSGVGSLQSAVPPDRSKFDLHFAELRALFNGARPDAALWHQVRRNSMLKRHRERLRRIIAPGGGSGGGGGGIEGTEGRGDHEVTVAAVLAICMGHVVISLYYSYSWKLVFLLSWTFGSFFAFGFQSMNHILMHSSLPLSVSKPLALLSSALGPMPWYSYYMSGGHARHHKLAGTERDIDREALFWIWERVPHKRLDNAAGSVAWASAAALLLPFAYCYSLLTCTYYNYRQNEVELFHFLTESLFKITFFSLLCTFGSGFKTFVYLCFSGGFSVGLLCHPYLSFWILQHSCAVDPDSPSKSQPTVSYYGSSLWNWLNYNILLHVEHHDFARMPWHRVQELRHAFPEYYQNLRSCNSCMKLIYTWIHAKGDKLDFCCEHCFGQDFVKNL